VLRRQANRRPEDLFSAVIRAELANGDRSVSSRGTYDYWLVKTDAGGTKQWDKRYGGADIDLPFRYADYV